MPSARLPFRRTESEAAIVEAIESTGDGTAKSSWFKKMAAYVIYVMAAALILWQSRSLHFNQLSATGYMLLSLRLFVIVTLVLSCVKLALGFRDFHSQLHNEEYIPSKVLASGAMNEGSEGDDMEYLVNFCRSQGFPLPWQTKSDPESDDEEGGDVQGVELRFQYSSPQRASTLVSASAAEFPWAQPPV